MKSREFEYRPNNNDMDIEPINIHIEEHMKDDIHQYYLSHDKSNFIIITTYDLFDNDNIIGILVWNANKDENVEFLLKEEGMTVNDIYILLNNTTVLKRIGSSNSLIFSTVHKYGVTDLETVNVVSKNQDKLIASIYSIKDSHFINEYSENREECDETEE